MKKILLILTLFISQLGNTQIVDVFNYTGALNANGWTTHSGTPAQIITNTSSLTYPGLAASTGNKASLPNGSEDVNIPISGIVGTGYSSFIMSVPSTANTSTGTNGVYFYGFAATAGATGVSSFHGKIWIKQGATANTFKLGLTYTGSTPSFTTTEFGINTPVFVVVSVDTAAHTANLFVNPTPGSPAPTATLTDASGTTSPNFGSIFLRQAAGSGDIEIDEIRVGSTFASVTPAGVASCNISSVGLTALTCNDAGTASVATDDYLTFSLNPTGTLLGTTYSVSVSGGTITPTTGTYGSATTFQLQAGSAGAGNVTLTVTDDASSTCSLDETITDPGSCSSVIPVITMNPASLTGFTQIVGTPSTEQTFTVSGLGLTSDITLTAPTNFEISLTTGSGFANSIVLPQTAGVVSATTIHVRSNSSVASGLLIGDILATSTGAANDTLHLEGFADDYVSYNIGEVSTVNADGVADSLDVLVKLIGVVHCIDFDGNTGYSITLIDSNNDGINLFSFADVSGYTDPSEGDSIEVFGKIAQYNGLLEVDADSIALLSTDASIQTPTIVTSLDETTESQYIKMMNLTLVTPMASFATGSSNVEITNGIDTFVMRIDSDTDLPGTSAPQGEFSVVGVGGQFDNSIPYTSGYQIFPCGVSSIENACTIPSNATTLTDSATATATATGVSYQWINCATNAPIANATSQSFTAITSGDYAVIVSDSGCVDTSACVTLAGSNVGLGEMYSTNSLEVYPNPVNDVLNLKNNSTTPVHFEIVDVQGKVILNSQIVISTSQISTTNWERGVYFVKYTANSNQSIVKIVK